MTTSSRSLRSTALRPRVDRAAAVGDPRAATGPWIRRHMREAVGPCARLFVRRARGDQAAGDDRSGSHCPQSLNPGSNILPRLYPHSVHTRPNNIITIKTSELFRLSDAAPTLRLLRLHSRTSPHQNACRGLTPRCDYGEGGQ